MSPRQITDALVVLVKSLLITCALVYLAEYFGWSLVREAAGHLI